MNERRWRRLGTILLVCATVQCAAACGGGGDDAFKNCGNDVLDPGEECDDGNRSDDDGCLSTCVVATCGDGFVDQDAEDCDGNNLAGESCATLGLGGGALACNAQCEFDTGACGVAPTATPVVVATPTPTVAGPDPTPTMTPDAGGGGTCSGGESVLVEIDIDSAGVGLAGVQLTLDYPASVSLPGSIDAPSVAERVTIIPSVGFKSVNDEDTQPDGVDDRLNVSVVSGSAFADGPFADVDFDCEAGSTPPGAGGFTCVVEGSDEFGGLVATTCVLAVTGP
jgi:cysteine-rich repeat protein